MSEQMRDESILGEALRDVIDEIPAFKIFHEALDSVEEGVPDWKGAHLEIVGAELVEGGAPFLLAHEPDGPWLTVCPLSPESMGAMELPACPWAEKQRWVFMLRLRGKRESDGQWWLTQMEVTT